jgi:hypothetical protein
MMVSNCKSSQKWCRFTRVRETPEAYVEKCDFCHRRVDYRIKGGTIDNRKYLSDHIRDTCQPYGRTKQVFEQVYANKRR